MEFPRSDQLVRETEEAYQKALVTPTDPEDVSHAIQLLKEARLGGDNEVDVSDLGLTERDIQFLRSLGYLVSIDVLSTFGESSDIVTLKVAPTRPLTATAAVGEKRLRPKVASQSRGIVAASTSTSAPSTAPEPATAPTAKTNVRKPPQTQTKMPAPWVRPPW